MTDHPTDTDDSTDTNPQTLYCCLCDKMRTHVRSEGDWVCESYQSHYAGVDPITADDTETETDADETDAPEPKYDYSQTDSPWVVRTGDGLRLRVDEVTPDNERYVTIESPPTTADGEVIVDGLMPLSDSSSSEDRWLLPGFFSGDEEEGEILTPTDVKRNVTDSVSALIDLGGELDGAVDTAFAERSRDIRRRGDER